MAKFGGKNPKFCKKKFILLLEVVELVPLMGNEDNFSEFSEVLR